MSSSTSWSKSYNSCIGCGTNSIPHKAKGLCSRCYQQIHKYPEEICHICGKLRRVHSRALGTPICNSCYQRPTHLCEECGRTTYSAVKSSNSYICQNCYNKNHRSRFQCDVCGNNEILAVNSNNRKICVHCYSNGSDICSKCGRHIKAPYAYNNSYICPRCYELNKGSNSKSESIDITKNNYMCNRCGKTNDVKKVFNDGCVICQDCYNHKPAICVSCNSIYSDIYSHLSTEPYCRICFYEKKVKSLLENYTKEFEPKYVNILSKYIIQKSTQISYEGIYSILNRAEKVFDFLNSNFDKFKNNVPLECIESLYEKYPHSKLLLNDFTSFLYENNFISSNDNNIRLVNKLVKSVNNLPQNYYLLVLKYRDWLISKIENYASKGWIEENSRFKFSTCYQYLITSIRFINTLVYEFGVDQKTQISDDLVDMYLAVKPYDSSNLRHFIKFMNSSKIIFKKLLIPPIRMSKNLPIGLCEKQQMQLLDKCLYGDQLSLRDKMIILLMLLFGLTPEKIKELTFDDISYSIKKNKTFIRLHGSNFELPTQMGNILNSYLSILRIKHGYLFAGRYIDKPLSPSAIWLIAKTNHVTPTDLYYTCVRNLLSNGINQPALLMRFLGVNHITATNYYSFFKGALKYE